MDWRIYRERYNIFCASIGGSGVLAHIGFLFLIDFPHNLPLGLREFVCERMTKFLLSMKKVDNNEKLVVSDMKNSFIPKNDQEEALIESCLCLALGEQSLTYRFQWDIFSRSQQLVMIFAYFDAFFSDSVIAICNLRPEVLQRKKKQISWKEALDQDNIGNIQQYLTEIYVHELCFNNIPKRLQILKKDISLELNIPPSDLEFIQYAELIRHLIVHTGGRVTPEFLKRARHYDKELKIGDFVKIDSNFLSKVSSCILLLCSDLFYKVSNKFYGISEKELGTFWYRYKSI